MATQGWRDRLIGQRLREGAVIAYPTEGVWGLGCLPEFPEAVARILQLKRRSYQQGLILVAAEIGQFEPYLSAITPEERGVLEAAWPAAVTFLVPDNGYAPEWIRGRHDTVALRVSAHPVIQALCRETGEPMVSTSANPAGRAPATTLLRVRQYFPTGIDFVYPGEVLHQGGASEIRELATGSVVRAARPG